MAINEVHELISQAAWCDGEVRGYAVTGAEMPHDFARAGVVGPVRAIGNVGDSRRAAAKGEVACGVEEFGDIFL